MWLFLGICKMIVSGYIPLLPDCDHNRLRKVSLHMMNENPWLVQLLEWYSSCHGVAQLSVSACLLSKAYPVVS